MSPKARTDSKKSRWHSFDPARSIGKTPRWLFENKWDKSTPWRCYWGNFYGLWGLILTVKIQGVLENNVRLGLKLGNYHYCHLMMALAQFGILKHNRFLRKEMILGEFKAIQISYLFMVFRFGATISKWDAVKNEQLWWTRYRSCRLTPNPTPQWLLK